MLSKKDIGEIKQRLDAATPGQWVSYIEGRDHSSGSDFIKTGVGGEDGPDIELNGATRADQDFIAHSRQDIALLIEDLEKLRRIDDEEEEKRGRAIYFMLGALFFLLGMSVLYAAGGKID